MKRLDQVGKHGSLTRLHKSFHGHAGDQLDLAEPSDLIRCRRDSDRVVALAGALIGRGIRRDPADHAVYFRRGPLTESREPQHGFLADSQLIDVLWGNLCLHSQIIRMWNDEHDGVTASGYHAANRVHGCLMHRSVLGCTDVYALELIF